MGESEADEKYRFYARWRQPRALNGMAHHANDYPSTSLGYVPFGVTYEKIGTIQRRLAWPLHKDDTLSRSGDLRIIIFMHLLPFDSSFPFNLHAGLYIEDDFSGTIPDLLDGPSPAATTAFVLTMRCRSSGLLSDLAYTPHPHHSPTRRTCPIGEIKIMKRLRGLSVSPIFRNAGSTLTLFCSIRVFHPGFPLKRGTRRWPPVYRFLPFHWIGASVPRPSHFLESSTLRPSRGQHHLFRGIVGIHGAGTCRALSKGESDVVLTP